MRERVDLFRPNRVALAGDPAQHRVDQRREMLDLRIRLGEAHREIDGGMIGHREVEDLRGAGHQQGEEVRPVFREAVAQPGRQRCSDEAEAAEARRGDRPGERGLAGFQPRPAPGLRQGILQRQATGRSEEGRDRFAGDVARREPRDRRVEGGRRAAFGGRCHA
ncbi:hypothetical protein CHKEEEPN_1597 [Methylorubrum podarium]|nr:hypothetical protein CHKEEEPN_1597 [Methylorubrum podarium]